MILKLKIILLLNLQIQSQHVESFLNSHGIRARVEVVNLSEPLILGNQLTYFYKLRQVFKRKKNEHIHVFTEPFLDASFEENMLGLAVQSEKISFSTWNEANSKGEPRTLHSWQIFAHEVGHQLKLKHTKGCKDLMDEDLGRCPNIAELSFSKKQRSLTNRRK